jgi:hypothetical protein
MAYAQEIEMILDSLNRDKRELLDKIAGIDKVIKRIKYGNLNLGLSKEGKTYYDNNEDDKALPANAFPLKADLKVQAIKIFDTIGVACKLRDVQEKYKELTGLNSNLRETLRNLNKHEILKLIQPKGTQRGLYWVKTEWLEENGTRLQENHKFEGFDLLFTDDMIEFK